MVHHNVQYIKLKLRSWATGWYQWYCIKHMTERKPLNNKSENVFFDNYFSNVDFSFTKAYTDFKFCLLSVYTHLERKESQIFYLRPSFYFMTKIGKHFINILISFF